MLLNVTDLRQGIVFEENGQPWSVISYEHIKMGRGSATIKIKARNLKTGSILEKSFISGARVTAANIEKKTAQYLYADKAKYCFMDEKTFEQFEISDAVLGDKAKFLKEGLSVKVMLYQDEAIDLELPLKIVFTIAEADAGFKGNSVTNIYKDAILDNGLKIRVPMFIKAGEKILINTETGDYVERVKA